MFPFILAFSAQSFDFDYLLFCVFFFQWKGPISPSSFAYRWRWLICIIRRWGTGANLALDCWGIDVIFFFKKKTNSRRRSHLAPPQTAEALVSPVLGGTDSDWVFLVHIRRAGRQQQQQKKPENIKKKQWTFFLSFFFGFIFVVPPVSFFFFVFIVAFFCCFFWGALRGVVAVVLHFSFLYSRVVCVVLRGVCEVLRTGRDDRCWPVSNTRVP